MKVKLVNKKYLVKIAGQYYIQKEGAPLGKGAFGTVYKMFASDYHWLTKNVSNVRKDRSIALKVSKSIRSNFELKQNLNQAKVENDLLVGNLRKRGVVNQVIAKDDRIYAAMPDLGSHELYDYFSKPKQVSEFNAMKSSDLFRWLSEMADQMVELHNITHTKSFVHLDLKPENIMVDDVLGFGVKSPMLIDFGFAKELISSGLKEGEKPLGKFRDFQSGKIGTGSYMAPETYGMGRSSNKSDIYTAGLIYMAMLGDVGRLVGRHDEQENIEERQKYNLKLKIQRVYMLKMEPLYRNNDSLMSLKVPKDKNQALLRDSLARFINRMTYKKPEVRPSALQVSRFFRRMQRYCEISELVGKGFESIDDIMVVKGLIKKYGDQYVTFLGKYKHFSVENKLGILHSMIIIGHAEIIEGLGADYRTYGGKLNQGKNLKNLSKMTLSELDRWLKDKKNENLLHRFVSGDAFIKIVANSECDKIRKNLHTQINQVNVDVFLYAFSKTKDRGLFALRNAVERGEESVINLIMSVDKGFFKHILGTEEVLTMDLIKERIKEIGQIKGFDEAFMKLIRREGFMKSFALAKVKGLSEKAQCMIYQRHLVDKLQPLEVLNLRLESLGYSYDRPLKLKEDYDENQKKLLERALSMKRSTSYQTLVRGNLAMDKVKDLTPKKLQEKKRSLVESKFSKLLSKITGRKNKKESKLETPSGRKPN